MKERENRELVSNKYRVCVAEDEKALAKNRCDGCTINHNH